MAEAQARSIGLPWYSREDYPGILAVMEDRHNFAPTYDQWLMAAENNESVGQQAGLTVVRVMIEPGSFARWCEDKGLTPGSAARAAYASELASAREGGS
jgi:hypothetical protein